MEADVTVKDLEVFFARYAEKREEYELLTKKKSKVGEELELMEKSATEILMAQDLEKYVSKSGTFYFRYEATVLTPKSTEDKLAFAEWLKGEGILNEYMTFNSISINSLYKRQVEAIGDPMVEIPGLKKGSNLLKTSFRRVK